VSGTPVQAHLVSESLRNDGRIGFYRPGDGPPSPDKIPWSEGEDYFLEGERPELGKLVPRSDIASPHNAKERV